MAVELKDKLVTLESLKEVYDQITLEHLGLNVNPEELNKMSGVTANTEEMNYLVGVTSPIQNQIDSISSDIQNQIDSISSDVAYKTIVTNAILQKDCWDPMDDLQTDGSVQYHQDITVDHVTVTNTIIVGADWIDRAVYADCSVSCYSQSEGLLGFACETLPDSDIRVNILILN